MCLLEVGRGREVFVTAVRKSESEDVVATASLGESALGNHSEKKIKCL